MLPGDLSNAKNRKGNAQKRKKNAKEERKRVIYIKVYNLQRKCEFKKKRSE